VQSSSENDRAIRRNAKIEKRRGTGRARLRAGEGCRHPGTRKHNAGTCPALVVNQGGKLRRPRQVHIDVNIIEGARQPTAFGAFE